VTDGEALIRSVLANPADNAPRLVYADWLEERGRPEDADFIRVQIELARLGFGDAFHKDGSGHLRHMPAHVERLTERQLELWFAGYGRADLPDEMVNWPMTVHSTPGQNLLLCRGFVERITMFADVFLEVARGLFARQPVTHVRLVDLMPLHEPSTDDFHWDFVSESYLGPVGIHTVPRQILARSPELRDAIYRTADEADAAMSWACVRFGRAAAGIE
jgi:uncharacterized protein (TIGR02996 family)